MTRLYLQVGLSRHHGLYAPLGKAKEHDDIKEEYFGGAVIDNFAAKEQQRYWHR